MRQAICTVLASLLLLEPMMLARASAEASVQPQQTNAQQPTLKETLLSIPPQSYVEVRLLDKSKLRGRLGEVTDEGFALQVAQGNKIQNVKVSFDQVKSIKSLEKKGTSAGKVIAYSLAGIGVFFLALFIYAAATGFGD